MQSNQKKSVEYHLKNCLSGIWAKMLQKNENPQSIAAFLKKPSAFHFGHLKWTGFVHSSRDVINHVGPHISNVLKEFSPLPADEKSRQPMVAEIPAIT